MSGRSGDGKEWTTFVLIPGAGADPRVYEATIAALHDLGHDGIAPPLPLEDPDAGPSAHADAVIAALPDPRPEPLVIVGQSHGGWTAGKLVERLAAATGGRERVVDLLVTLDPISYEQCQTADIKSAASVAGLP